MEHTGHYGVRELAHYPVVLGHAVIVNHTAGTHLILVEVDAVHSLDVALVRLEFRIVFGDNLDLPDGACEGLLLGVGFRSAALSVDILSHCNYVAECLVLVLVVRPGQIHEG